MSNADELRKLKELKDEGVLSEEEFQSEKARILAGEVPQKKEASDGLLMSDVSSVDPQTRNKLLRITILLALMLGIGWFVYDYKKTEQIKEDEKAKVRAEKIRKMKRNCNSRDFYMPYAFVCADKMRDESAFGSCIEQQIVSEHGAVFKAACPQGLDGFVKSRR